MGLGFRVRVRCVASTRARAGIAPASMAARLPRAPPPHASCTSAKQASSCSLVRAKVRVRVRVVRVGVRGGQGWGWGWGWG